MDLHTSFHCKMVGMKATDKKQVKNRMFKMGDFDELDETLG